MVVIETKICTNQNTCEWVDQAQTDGHLTKGNVTRLKGAFDRRFQNFPDPSTCILARNGFIEWTKKAKSEKHITQGNVNWIVTTPSRKREGF